VEQDIQTGTLDEFIPLSPSQRDYLETRMAPNPKVAAKLERLLCRLGFHRRASGKIQPYAHNAKLLGSRQGLMFARG
jgi:hypothetical protein